MEYAQLNETLTEATQVTYENIEWDEKNFCSAGALVKDGKAEQFRIVPLKPTDPPSYDWITQKINRDGCEKVNGEWQYRWKIESLSPEQILINQKARVPQVITRRQFFIALVRINLYDIVETIIAESTDIELKITYATAQEFERNNPMLISMLSALGETEDDVDNFFILGATL